MAFDVENFLAQLREHADEQHRSATVAIEILRDYLRGPSGSIPQQIAVLLDRAGVPANQNGNGKSYRDTVLTCIREEGLTVKQIIMRTGLTPARIRAVLYDRKIKDKVFRESAGGQLRFKLRNGP